MLNHDDAKDGPKTGAKGVWRVGEAPVRWDVGLGARLAQTIKALFWRDKGERALTREPLPPVADGPRDGRRAA
jgi:hypothetical protein